MTHFVSPQYFARFFFSVSSFHQRIQNILTADNCLWNFILLINSWKGIKTAVNSSGRRECLSIMFLAYLKADAKLAENGLESRFLHWSHPCVSCEPQQNNSEKLFADTQKILTHETYTSVCVLFSSEIHAMIIWFVCLVGGLVDCWLVLVLTYTISVTKNTDDSLEEIITWFENFPNSQPQPVEHKTLQNIWTVFKCTELKH